jgi:hypothetical protein
MDHALRTAAPSRIIASAIRRDVTQTPVSLPQRALRLQLIIVKAARQQRM